MRPIAYSSLLHARPEHISVEYKLLSILRQSSELPSKFTSPQSLTL